MDDVIDGSMAIMTTLISAITQSMCAYFFFTVLAGIRPTESLRPTAIRIVSLSILRPSGEYIKPHSQLFGGRSQQSSSGFGIKCIVQEDFCSGIHSTGIS